MRAVCGASCACGAGRSPCTEPGAELRPPPTTAASRAASVPGSGAGPCALAPSPRLPKLLPPPLPPIAAAITPSGGGIGFPNPTADVCGLATTAAEFAASERPLSTKRVSSAISTVE
eukprot:CAMPEP_0179868986 /NCGR_PEP_ID=MMETSP0982-20121206/19220_1 /TAXON_ID=483367 /ORGANISM="non described non described, Strain CCMP 2436" /LENGTH=116 /DNA_ID=CAMNT_0021758897 /DNA_START=198 /DNA_END=548 /DNA_ORIENTATION=+